MKKAHDKILIGSIKIIAWSVPVIISIIALIFSFGANQKSNHIAGRTYLSVKPVKLSHNLMAQRLYEKNNDPAFDNYFSIVNTPETSLTLLTFEINNSGPHAAENAVLHVNFNFASPTMPYVQKWCPAKDIRFNIGTLAPNQSIIQEVNMIIPPEYNLSAEEMDLEIPKEFQKFSGMRIGDITEELYNAGLIGCDISAYITYLNGNNESQKSNVYIGGISRGGHFLSRLPENIYEMEPVKITIDGEVMIGRRPK